MSKQILIIDYGMGNLHSVANAFDYIGAQFKVSGNISDFSGADALLLPGVGAFPDASRVLFENGFADNITHLANQGMPLLGICLGMQLLLDESDEVRTTKGLGLIKGKCTRIADTGLKIPHIGWNNLSIDNPDCEILKQTRDGSFVYFVHSFKAVLDCKENLAAHTNYGEDIPAVIQNKNVFGAQFHPEKSESVGLDMLKSFCRYAGVIK